MCPGSELWRKVLCGEYQLPHKEQPPCVPLTVGSHTGRQLPALSISGTLSYSGHMMQRTVSSSSRGAKLFHGDLASVGKAEAYTDCRAGSPGQTSPERSKELGWRVGF